MTVNALRIGTAGWTIPRPLRDRFPENGTGLERYAARFVAAEVNSTFYRSHKPETLERWAAAVPEGFRFSIKAPKAITHDKRLVDTAELLEAFLNDISVLGPKLGPLLVQLPPSLAFDEPIAGSFFAAMRERTEGLIACEPRHASWFEPPAERILQDLRIARVAADPARVPEAASPGGWSGLVYYRLHGSPRMYYSEYDEAFLAALAAQLGNSGATETWCVFDNTTSGAAAANALQLRDRTASSVLEVSSQV